MDEFGIVATWALTGHLFYEACEECNVCPVLELKGKDRRFDQIWGTKEAMWYGADVVDALLSRSSGHEIGCHGYTHRTFDRLSREEAAFEIQEWLRLAARKGLVPQTVIFPQGRIKHLELFRQAGFICYRGAEVRHPALTIPLLGKVLDKINRKLAVLTPQTFEATVDSLGMVNVPGSLWLFRTKRRVELLLDALNLHTLRLRLAARSIRRAAEEAESHSLLASPPGASDRERLRKVAFCVRALRRAGQGWKA